MNKQAISGRLEYLRGQLQAECISYSELAELQDLAPYIALDDIELLEAAGVPEFHMVADGVSCNDMACPECY